MCLINFLVGVKVEMLSLPISAESRLRWPVGGTTFTRRREPASLVTRTRRLTKRQTAKHGAARMTRDSRAWHHSCSGVYI